MHKNSINTKTLTILLTLLLAATLTATLTQTAQAEAVFYSGFETGDFSDFESFPSPGEITNTIKYNGTFAFSVTMGAASNSYIDTTLTAQTEHYSQLFVYINAALPTNTVVGLARGNFSATTCTVALKNDGTATTWILRDGAGNWVNSTVAAEPNTWYRVTMKAVVDDETALYINGSRAATGSAPTGTNNKLYVGAWRLEGTTTNTQIIIDDVAVQTHSDQTLTLTPATSYVLISKNLEYTTTATDIFGYNLGEVEAAYSIEPGAGGTWTDNNYLTGMPGTWTVTSSYDGLTDTATLTIASTGGSPANTTPTPTAPTQTNPTAPPIIEIEHLEMPLWFIILIAGFLFILFLLFVRGDK